MVNTKESQEAYSEFLRITRLCDARQGRYIRNLNRYLNNRTVRNDLNSLYDVTANYNFTYYTSSSDFYSTYNIIKSAIDTIASKISQSRVRPFFGTVDGSFQARKACNSAQKFFDLFFEHQNIYNQAAECARDAMIFDYGVMWIDDDKNTISRVAPFNVYIDPYEAAQGICTKAGMFIKYFPHSGLEAYIGAKAKDIVPARENTVSFAVVYNLKEKRKHYFVNGVHALSKSIAFDTCPFEFLYWSTPIKGFFSMSAADEIYNIQCKIDRTEIYINEAYKYAIKNQIVVPEGTIKKSKITDKSGEIVEYLPSPTPYPPIMFNVPQPISPMYQARLDDLIRKGYEMLGVSALSAQSKKPSGANSGVALETLQDVESERFNVFLRNYITFQTNLAIKCIDIFPAESEIIPSKTYKGVTWGDLVKAKDTFQVQFSSAHALSKDPSEKLKQIQSLMSMGFMDARTASTLLEIPDLEKAYSIVNAAYDYCETIIERAIQSGNTPDFIPVVDLDLLLTITSTYIMRMDTNKVVKSEMDALVKLFKDVKARKDQAMQSQVPPPPEMPKPIPSVSVSFKDLPQYAQEAMLSSFGITPPQAGNIPPEAGAVAPQVPQSGLI